jgi:hypothetical protein
MSTIDRCRTSTSGQADNSTSFARAHCPCPTKSSPPAALRLRHRRVFPHQWVHRHCPTAPMSPLPVQPPPPPPNKFPVARAWTLTAPPPVPRRQAAGIGRWAVGVLLGIGSPVLWHGSKGQVGWKPELGRPEHHYGPSPVEQCPFSFSYSN